MNGHNNLVCTCAMVNLFSNYLVCKFYYELFLYFISNCYISDGSIYPIISFYLFRILNKYIQELSTLVIL